jgi:hypothetical protein
MDPDRLGPDEVPPQRIWHHDELLAEWFQSVKQRRQDQAKGVEAVPDATEDEHTLHNDLTKGLRD